MIRIKLQSLLDKEERSLHWVSSKTNISYATLHKFCNNKTNAVSYSVLDNLCKLFNCNIEDIMEYEKHDIKVKIIQGDKVIKDYNTKD